MWNTIVLCTVLRNAWVVECLGDSVPKLACAAEQAPTRSHLTHSGELVYLHVFLRGGHLVSGQFSRGDESLPTLDRTVFHLS